MVLVIIVMDIVIEIIRALIVGVILIYLLANKRIRKVRTIQGWNYFLAGFGLIVLGSAVDITDNFEALNRFVIIGDTQYQAIIEKMVGYLFGFLLLATGIWKWMPGIIELDMKRKRELEDAFEEIKILSGLLPICMDCNKIRDDSGYWNKIEKYIREHSEAELSHCLCDECLQKRFLSLDATRSLESR